MTTITIPKRITKGEELVIIPRKDYERLSDFRKKIKKIKPLDKDIEQSLKEVKAGKTIGPFETVDEMVKSLEK
ncbi:MAG: hypothetical protein WBC21_04360 [Minisyncoccales bacterium]